MESHGKKQGRFQQTFKKYPDSWLKNYGLIQRKVVYIAICPTTKKNCINVDLASQLMLSDSDIIEDNTFFSNEKYEIKNLQLSIDYYKFIA